MLNIVVCEDEAIVRKGIRKILETSYKDVASVTECENGFEGYKTILSLDPDLVITDIRMPVMSGIQMIEKALKTVPAVKYIIISAYKDFEYAQSAIKFGVKDYVLKPINHFEFLSCINRVLNIESISSANTQKEDVIEHSCVSEAISYIEQNFYKNISLDDVSREVQMNTNYLSTLFKKQTGMKYIDYLTKLRMEKAHNLICNTNLKINAISEMVGFNSTKHFTRLYKEKYGETPTAVRENK